MLKDSVGLVAIAGYAAGELRLRSHRQQSEWEKKYNDRSTMREAGTAPETAVLHLVGRSSEHKDRAAAQVCAGHSVWGRFGQALFMNSLGGSLVLAFVFFLEPLAHNVLQGFIQ